MWEAVEEEGVNELFSGYPDISKPLKKAIKKPCIFREKQGFLSLMQMVFSLQRKFQMALRSNLGNGADEQQGLEVE